MEGFYGLLVKTFRSKATGWVSSNPSPSLVVPFLVGIVRDSLSHYEPQEPLQRQILVNRMEFANVGKRRCRTVYGDNVRGLASSFHAWIGRYYATSWGLQMLLLALWTWRRRQAAVVWDTPCTPLLRYILEAFLPRRVSGINSSTPKGWQASVTVTTRTCNRFVVHVRAGAFSCCATPARLEQCIQKLIFDDLDHVIASVVNPRALTRPEHQKHSITCMNRTTPSVVLSIPRHSIPRRNQRKT